MSARRAIGIGCASDARVDDVLALVRETAGDIGSGTLLGTLDKRRAIARDVAAALDLDFVVFSARVLENVEGVETYSQRALAAVGTPSVAEASALAALGPEARLVIPRRTGVRCTCAVAELA